MKPANLGPLFEARARCTDPETSHAAAREADESGRTAKQRFIVLEYVERVPGATAAEIAVLAGLERHVPSRRLPELREAGLVRNGAARICRKTGRKSLTWWPRYFHASIEEE